MPHKLEALQTREDLYRALEESDGRPLLLFKHSKYCGISAEALSELQAYLPAAPTDFAYKIITVQTDRPVSNEAADHLQVEHHTPQAILVHNGRVVWNASHWGITSETLKNAVSLVP